MRHQRLIDLSQAPNVESFKQQLIAAGEELGFGLISAAVVVDRGDRPQFHPLTNAPKGFQEASIDYADSLRDPVLQLLKRQSFPFLYDQELYVRAGAGDLWEQQASWGYRNGVSVCLHLPGNEHFILGLNRPEPLPSSDADLTRVMADLQLLAVFAHGAANKLLLPPSQPTATIKLTARELEVLKWGRDGKTAWETGMILGIAERSVNYHIGNAIRKLGVSSGRHAVVVAMRLGLI